MFSTDGHGCRFSTTGGWGESGIGQFSLEQFNRREETVRLAAFKVMSGRGPFAEFSVPNPAPSTAPAFVAEPLPVRRTVEGTEFALTDLKHHYFGAAPFAGARFEARGRDGDAGTWEPVGLTVSDAAENVLETSNPRLYETKDPADAGRAWFPALCMREAAWKVDTVFAPPPSTRATASHTWTIRGVPVPAPPQPGGTSSTREFRNSTYSQGGITLRLVEVYRGGSEHGRVPGNEEEQSALVWAAAPEDGFRLTLSRVTDDHRRDLTLRPGPAAILRPTQ